MGGDGFASGIQKGLQVAVFPRLDQAQMAFRQGQVRKARQAAEHGNIRMVLGHGGAQDVGVPGAADAVEHHPGDGHVRPVVDEATD